LKNKNTYFDLSLSLSLSLFLKGTRKGYWQKVAKMVTEEKSHKYPTMPEVEINLN
jgi:hypothetical protein